MPIGRRILFGIFAYALVFSEDTNDTNLFSKDLIKDFLAQRRVIKMRNYYSLKGIIDFFCWEDTYVRFTA